MSRRILLVEDELGMILTLSDRLRAEGFEVTVATDGEAGQRSAERQPFDLLILDVMLPGKNGLDLCRDLRRAGITVPILMLTARAELTDRVIGLKLGADDYLTKPFEPLELMARIEALLRRPAAYQPDARPSGSYRFGAVQVDFRSAEVTRDGRSLSLSARELELLRYLIQHPHTVLTREALLAAVWGYDAMPTTRTVDVHVARLRRKLEPTPRAPRHILTVHGQGYKFVG